MNSFGACPGHEKNRKTIESLRAAVQAVAAAETKAKKLEAESETLRQGMMTGAGLMVSDCLFCAYRIFQVFHKDHTE